MIAKSKVTEIVNQWLEDKEYFLVEVSVSTDNCVSVEIDHADGVWIEDCVQLSKHIEANLNRDEEDYELEVVQPVSDNPSRCCSSTSIT